MRMRLFTVILCLLFVLVACDDNLVKPEDYTFEVSGGIERYALTMSSVPGLPIDATSQLLNEELELEVHYFCTQGTFLSWEGGPVEDLEDSVYHDFENHTIYWSPLEDNQGGLNYDGPVEVHIDVLDKSNGMLVESSMHFIYLENGYYAFDVIPE